MRGAIGPARERREPGKRGRAVAIAAHRSQRPLTAGHTDADLDDGGIDRLQRRIGKSDTVHITVAEILDDDIGPGDQFLRHLHPARIGQVDRDAKLAGIGDCEESGTVGISRTAGKRR
jgi:hypothetical protein